MLDIGFQEVLVLMVIALVVFGPDKLPDLGRRLGRAMREFRRASDEFRSTIETNLRIHEDILPPSASLDAPSEPAALAGGGSGGSTDGAGAAEPGAAAPAGGEAAARAASGDGLGADGEPAEPFWTRRGGKLLHRSDCAWRGRVPETERVGFKTAAEGREGGLLPCPACDPREAEEVVS